MCKKVANPVSFILVSILLILLDTPGTSADLLVEDASDGPCLSMSAIMHHLYHGVNLRTIITSGNYYVPMASKALYRQYAKGLLGRPALNQDELESMQLVLRCGPLFSTIDNIGFQYLDNVPHFGQTCISGGLPSLPNLGLLSGDFNMDMVQAVCVGLPAVRPNGTMDFHASPSFRATMDSIVWVNEEGSVFLTYRCPGDGLKDFKVVSKTTTLSEHDINAIKEKVLELGFKEENIAFMKYNLPATAAPISAQGPKPLLSPNGGFNTY